MEELVLLHFTTASPPYRAGEVAGFPAPEAAAYLERKLARRVDRREADRIHAKNVPAPAKEAEELVVVRFNRSHPPYMAGELAGFTAGEAQRLTDARSDGPPIASFVRQAPLGPVGVTVPKEPRRRRPGAKQAPPAPELVKVRFLQAGRGYQKGEVAGFEADVAEALLEEGVAVRPEDWPEGAEAPAPPPPAAGDPPAATVDPGAEVLGLDDRKPDWREDQGSGEKAPPGPPADKAVKRPPRSKGKGKRGG